MAKSAELVADFLLANSDRKLTPMEVNKLVYISHGWMLALHDESLISEKIEAWKHGPVIPSLYHKFKMYGAEPIDALGYCSTPLIDPQMDSRKNFIDNEFTKNDKCIMRTVLHRHRYHKGVHLSGITHKKGSPWDQCFVKDKMHIEIPNHIIKEYYKKLSVSDK